MSDARSMKRFVALSVLAFTISACGNSAVDGDAVGQAKKITHVTPLFCDGYVAFEMSMGVMKNGSGSLSKEDVWFTVNYPKDVQALENAVKSAEIVHVRYNTRRAAFCTEDHILTGLIEETK